jgi:hypothetical protein
MSHDANAPPRSSVTLPSCTGADHDKISREETLTDIAERRASAARDRVFWRSRVKEVEAPGPSSRASYQDRSIATGDTPERQINLVNSREATPSSARGTGQVVDNL